MKFIDQVNIEVIAGKGGDGIISFRHEHRVEKGGPFGGDGGDGGNIYFQGDSGMNTLLPIHIMKHKVPLGSLVYENNKIICDIIDDQKYLIAKGGRGGRGNSKFKSSSNPAPKICENGTLGERKKITLELKVLADIGLVGLPSAGKSTILKLISNAKPKIGDYPFTTLVPQLGLVQYQNHSYVVADLPGLIKGSAMGKGLGIQFLKHIERCKLIAFVIDFGDSNKNPINDFETLKKELEEFNKEIIQRDFLIIANKKDLKDFDNHYQEFIKKYHDLPIIGISALNFEDLNQLKKKMFILYKNAKTIISNDKPMEEIYIKLEDDFKIEKLYEGMYEVSGKKIEEIYQRNPLNTYDNILRFNKKIKDIGL